MLRASTLAGRLSTNSRFYDVRVLRCGLALITGIIESEVSDLFIQRTDLMAIKHLCPYVMYVEHLLSRSLPVRKEEDAKNGCLLKTEM